MQSTMMLVGGLITGIALAQPAETQPAVILSGVAAWEGAKPIRTVVRTDSDPTCSQFYRENPYRSEDLVVNANSTLRNVFVYVKEGLPAHKKWPVPDEPVVLNTLGCRFEPRVFGVVVGQTLAIVNNDHTSHNANIGFKANRAFNVGQLEKGLVYDVKLLQSELMVRIQCDVHPWHSAYCSVLDHPFFAVTDELGRFEIKGLSPGEYLLEAQHEKLGSQTASVILEPGRATNIKFTFQSDKSGNAD